jgi:hypothetical protein
MNCFISFYGFLISGRAQVNFKMQWGLNLGESIMKIKVIPILIAIIAFFFYVLKDTYIS